MKCPLCAYGDLKKTQNVHQDKTRFSENFDLLLVQHTTLFETYIDYTLVPSNSIPKETCVFRPETSTWYVAIALSLLHYLPAMFLSRRDLNTFIQDKVF